MSANLSLATWVVLLVPMSLVLILGGLLWPWPQRIGLGRLPGDIVIEREMYKLYIPIGSSTVVSIVLTLLLWLVRR